MWERACAAAHLEAADLDAKLLSKLILQRLHLRAVVVALALELNQVGLTLVRFRLELKDGLGDLEGQRQLPPPRGNAVVCYLRESRGVRDADQREQYQREPRARRVRRRWLAHRRDCNLESRSPSNFHEDRSQTAEALLLYRSRVLNLLWPYVTCCQWENPKSRNFAGLAGFWSLPPEENVPTVATASIAGCGTVHHEHEHRSNPGRQFERGHQIVPKLACTLARTTPKSVSRR